MHDWGGPIGLRVATELADRVDRLVLMDTGVFTGEQPMSENWHRFREFVDRVEELPVSLLVRRALRHRPRRRGRRRLRRAVPERGGQGRRAARSRRSCRCAPTTRARRPAGARWRRCARTRGRRWCCGATATRCCRVKAGEALAGALGRPAPRVIDGAGHFLQEDQGALVGSLIADWLRSA